MSEGPTLSLGGEEYLYLQLECPYTGCGVSWQRVKTQPNSTNTTLTNYILTTITDTTSYVLPIYTRGNRVFHENFYIANNLPLREVTPENMIWELVNYSMNWYLSS